MTKLAILDIGTNSIHLVLAEVEPDFSYKILDRFKDMTRLGDGSFKSRRLSEAAMARGLEVIRALAPLTPRQRAAIALTDVLGFTSEQAGEALGASPVTVRVLAARGRARGLW